METSIVWFRNDLRVSCNPALFHSSRSGKVLPVYIWDDTLPDQEGGASRWWLYESLLYLERSLMKLGCPLICGRGKTKDLLLHYAKIST
ncbi:MAG: deoxyribodipyrimidine photo-lyase, partial [Leptospirillum sp.]